MDKEKLKQILLDQTEELDTTLIPNLCHRKEEDLVDLNSHLAQVVIGVRRSGKSTLCKNVLQKTGVKFGYVNFDDERIGDIKSDELDDILMTLYQMHGDLEYFFFDEIQNVEHWELFINRLLRQGKHLLITGSNSKLLSQDLATHLTGRHSKIELLPFSFAEFCDYNQVMTAPLTTKNRGLLARAFEQYLAQGGLPELLYEKDALGYVNSLYESILTQDIKRRFNVKNIEILRQLSQHLLNITPAIINKPSLRELFEIKSPITMDNYLSYLTQAYLILPIKKYSNKSSVRAQSEKIYAIDVAMMNKRENALVGNNLGWRLETIVYLELRRRIKYASEDIYYYAVQKSECDFVTVDGNTVTGVYQVSYDITNEKTRKREIAGCVSAAKATKCDNVWLITNSHTETIEANGVRIQCVPAYEWLTGMD